MLDDNYYVNNYQLLLSFAFFFSLINVYMHRGAMASDDHSTMTHQTHRNYAVQQTRILNMFFFFSFVERRKIKNVQRKIK